MKISNMIKKIAADLEIGDEILMGRFRNVPAIIKEFSIDKNNQPTIITTKGEKSLYKFRIKKLMEQK